MLKLVSLLVIAMLALSALAEDKVTAPATAETPTQIAPPAPPTGTPGPLKLAAVGKDQVGKFVADEGEIVEVFRPEGASKAPFKIFLKKEGEKLPLVIWKNIWEKIDFAADLKPGAKLYFRAKVADFKGQLQLSVDEASQLSLQAIPVASEFEGPVTREGEILSLKPMKSGLAIQIKDASGEIKVFIPKKMSDEFDLKKLAKGAKIKVTGQVKLFKDEKELVPDKAADVQGLP